MKKISLLSIIFILFFTCYSVKAIEVDLTGVYWSLEVEYGSGTNTLNHDENSYDETNLSIPHVYPVPLIDKIRISDDYYFDSYADYSGDSDYVEAYVQGFARDYNSSQTDWFSSNSFVAVASNTFTGLSLFIASFDWNFDVYFGSGDLDAQVGIALVDYTDPNNWFILKQEEINYDPNLPTSGTCNVSWTLDPSRIYLYGLWAQVELTGYEDPIDAFYATATITNIHARAVPEPATFLLLIIAFCIIYILNKNFCIIKNR